MVAVASASPYRRAVERAIVQMRQSGAVLISDTTLRDGEQMTGVSFSATDKARIAYALEQAGVHSIDAGFPAAGPEAVGGVRAVAAAVTGPTVMALARAVYSDIDCAAAALAEKPRTKRGVGVFIGTSPLHREEKLGLGRSGVLDAIQSAIAYAAREFDIIAFGAEDASRTEPDFLAQCLQVAIDAGATSVGIPDTVGCLLPGPAGDLVRRMLDEVPSIGRVLLAVHFHDDLGLAVANSLAAIEAGAHVVQCTVGGIGERAGNAALEELALVLSLHGNVLNRRAAIDTHLLIPLCRLVAELSGITPSPHKAVAGRNVFTTEAGIHQDGVLKDERIYLPFPPELVGAAPGVRLALGRHSGRKGLTSRLAELGIVLDDGSLDTLLARIKALPHPTDADDTDMLRYLVTTLAVAV